MKIKNTLREYEFSKDWIKIILKFYPQKLTYDILSDNKCRNWHFGFFNQKEKNKITIILELLAEARGFANNLINNEKTFTESVRLYNLDEMVYLISSAGLRIYKTFGGYDGSRYKQDSSRMILFAIKEWVYYECIRKSTLSSI